MTDWTKMASGDSLDDAYKERKSDIIRIRIPNNQIDSYLKKGYEIKIPGKTKSLIQIEKIVLMYLKTKYGKYFIKWDLRR